MKNQEIANLLREIAILLEIKGESRFRVLAYEEAARQLENLSEPVEEYSRKSELQSIPGIGEAIAQKIDEYLKQGKIHFLDELSREIPRGVADYTRIPGVGPRTAGLFYRELGISTFEELRSALAEGKIRLLPRLGAKSEEKIRKGLAFLSDQLGRMLLGYALPVVDEVVAFLKERAPVDKISPAGSIRRMKETIGDIDILVASRRAEEVSGALVSFPGVRDVLARGPSKTSIRTGQGMQIDLRVVDPDSFGAALQYFTGSKEHNVALRETAQKKGYKVNEYGIYRLDTGVRVGGTAEEEIYEALGMEWIPPEIRENQGEIELAMSKKLPRLVVEEDLRGDLHVHTHWSDGSTSVRDIAEAARKKGYNYLGLCDHTQSLVVASGLKPDQLRSRRLEIDQWNHDNQGFFVFDGVEVNILADGELDMNDRDLADRDLVIAGLHSGLGQEKDRIMRRLERALKNPHIQILSHPTGRLLQRRNPYQLDLDTLFSLASRESIILEINSQPERLDLKDSDARQARDGYGIPMVITSDAHNPAQLGYIRLGIAQARRGWLTAEDIVNTFSLERLKRFLKRP
ncbi:MAG TPA: DNA polymerase/3'-5' exonuclease PolX [Atribacteraceae bacterium]|nr:DNA polymerase/3'-5' exonuclease PolX [Atribacteraceae bacterium]